MKHTKEAGHIQHATGPVVPTGIALVIKTKSRFVGGELTLIPLSADPMPWENPAFIRGIIHLAMGNALARRSVTTEEEFVAECIKCGTLDPGILKEAQLFLQDLEADPNPRKWDEVEAFIKTHKSWELPSRDLDGLVYHFGRIAEEKASKPQSLLDKLK
jgi:hypothetical protein